ncbi:uncharacterized protein MYCGRDRAFT_106229 [Zymoseptoria tritici IPO323]|uniref:Uncharacterized protein n=1 Tax=Zymoseptoria tritici (strain CBS 115943 / IPO323) TaxID=336722 RepID=F9XM80_ZYMTI|nr:uncharacterized protein MYCGRDRAFT_106229 [Zymoseptoria tritici IPO323]EGP83496.1 hypothetical protein MYCGRDRAFT_106229 [Zymoseptoria tritici IPO323]
MLWISGALLGCVTFLVLTAKGLPAQAQPPTTSIDRTISTPPSKRWDHTYFGVMFNRFADENCEMKSLDRFDKDDERNRL